jgi:hypothetical protein
VTGGDGLGEHLLKPFAPTGSLHPASLRFAVARSRRSRALAAHEVPHALHVFPRGPHSLGLARGAGEASVWTELATDWLEARLGILNPRTAA